jgi:integrase
MATQLSNNTAKTAKAGDKRVIIWDKETAGFGLKVEPSGKRRWIIKYRIGKGRSAPIKYANIGIGDARYVDVDHARTEAKKYREHGREGRDYAIQAVAADAALDAEFDENIQDAMLSEDGIHPTQLKYAWMDEVDNNVGVTEGYRNANRRYYKIIERELGIELRTADLTVEHVRSIKNKMLDRPNSFNRFRTVLISVLNRQIEAKRIQSNVAKLVKPLQEKVRDVYLTEEGIKQFEAKFSDYAKFHHGYLNHVRALRCVLYTGQRPTTILTILRHDDGENNYVDFANKRLIIRRYKTARKSTAKAQDVLVTDKAIEIMKEARDAHDSPYVFANLWPTKSTYGKAISWVAIGRFFEKNKAGLEKAGTDKLTVYSLRHTFGTHLYKISPDLKSVGSMMLHTTTKTTERYAKVTELMREREVKNVAKIFG